MTPVEKARRILMADCGECWAGHNQQCDRAKIGEWIAIPTKMKNGIMLYFTYIHFHAARVKRAIRLGLLEEADVDMQGVQRKQARNLSRVRTTGKHFPEQY